METSSTPFRSHSAASNPCQALARRAGRLMLLVTGVPAYLKAISTFVSA